MLRSQFRNAKPKLKKCKICPVRFEAKSMAHVCCSPDCTISLALANREKKQRHDKIVERRQDAKRKEAIKPRSKWLSECQSIVNLYVRLRDARFGCVSCDKSAHWDGQWHASHYKSVGSNSALRFNLWNIHKSCSVCNNWLSGNIGEYAPRLAARIGLDRVQWLDNHPRSREYDIEYLKRLKAVFTKKVNRLKRK